LAAGVVKWFDGTKGFGFISPDGGEKDIFVHHSEIVGSGFKTLEQGERVEFEVADKGKGPRAYNVMRISQPAIQPSQSGGQNLGALLNAALGRKAQPGQRLRGGLD